MDLSKSKYCAYMNCPKECWLSIYKPELAQMGNTWIDNGHLVGEKAKELFGKSVDVSAVKENGAQDRTAMKDKTEKLINDGKTETICEAAFSSDGCYCAVDILHREGGGYAIYEVKSSSDAKQKYYQDIAFQKYVLEKWGINVTGTYLVHLNTDYVLDGELDLKGLFTIKDVSSDIIPFGQDIESNVAKAKAVIEQDTEPEVKLNKNCSGCDFWEYCSKDLPKPSVFDLHSFRDKWQFYDKGIITYGDVKSSGHKLSDRQRLQIEHTLNELPPEIKMKELQDFLNGLSYPLSFLDFETMQVLIPDIQGTRPYQKIPFQYSLHIVNKDGGKEIHVSFLANPDGDPRRELAESLIKNVPEKGSILAYSSSVEIGIVNKLAEEFPDLAEPLKKISVRIKDLEDVFNQYKNYYFCRAMGKFSTIKVVSHALYPEDEDMDYNNLEGVHNGTQAMSSFPQMKYMKKSEQSKLRRQLLKYCALDTRAMVKLWRKLVEVSK